MTEGFRSVNNTLYHVWMGCGIRGYRGRRGGRDYIGAWINMAGIEFGLTFDM